ncbi:MAG: hypothetical protein IJ785_03635 [Bacteroidales bacterium]|nr:hypothetical protein [Bacteroidales bacterium]
MKENKIYCAPIIEVLDARVEKGFAGSPVIEPQPDPVTPPDGGFDAGGQTGWSDGGYLLT